MPYSVIALSINFLFFYLTNSLGSLSDLLGGIFPELFSLENQRIFSVTENDSLLMVLRYILFGISLIPLIFVRETYKVQRIWEESFLIFWKRQKHQYQLKERVCFMGIITIGTPTIIVDKITFEQPPINVVAQDLYKIIPAFIPLVNSLVFPLINSDQNKSY